MDLLKNAHSERGDTRGRSEYNRQSLQENNFYQTQDVIFNQSKIEF